MEISDKIWILTLPTASGKLCYSVSRALASSWAHKGQATVMRLFIHSTCSPRMKGLHADLPSFHQ